MVRRLSVRLALLGGVSMVAACTGPNTKDVQIISGSQSNAAKPQPIRTLSQAEIQKVLTSHTFQYTLPQGNGIISYGPDGKLSYQDDAKGEGTGTWVAQEGQLCQKLGSAPQQCSEFKSTGDAYQIGQNGRIIEMKVE